MRVLLLRAHRSQRAPGTATDPAPRAFAADGSRPHEARPARGSRAPGSGARANGAGPAGTRDAATEVRSMSDEAREVHCRRTVTGYNDDGTERDERCPWRGPLTEFAEHTEETGHQACAVCSLPLADEEAGACGRCLDRVR